MESQLHSDKIERSDFEYHEKLDEGGCGIVFKATFKKKYNNHTEAAAKILTSLQRDEIHMLRRLRHDNIVTLIGYFEDGPTMVIFFEYTQYGSLYQYLSKDTTPLPAELQRRWAKEAALAIQFLHSKKILHRDLKASNCLLFDSPTGTLKLCDFGLAKDIDHSQTTSTQCGTYRFWAPEIIRADDQNHSVFSQYTDVWAYGMLVYEICSRRLPFFDKEWQVVIRHVGKGDLLPTIPSDCPMDLRQIMKSCWTSKPKERPSINSIVDKMVYNQDNWCLRQTMKPVLKVPDQQPKKLKAHRIAYCPDGRMVVADNDEHHFFMATSNGEYKAAFENQDKINYVSNIAVTRKYIAFCNWTLSSVLIFNSRCKFVNRFQAVENKAVQELTGLATDVNNNLVVWNKKQNKVTWFSCPKGEVLKHMMVSGEMKDFSCLAINSARQLIFYDNCKSTKVIAIDNTGKKLFSISPQIGERATGNTYKGFNLRVCGLVTDVNDAIYIALKVCTSDIGRCSGRVGKLNTGHIHRYSNTGKFLQCIKRGLHSPYDLSMLPDGSLVVANGQSILKYSIEPIAENK